MNVQYFFMHKTEYRKLFPADNFWENSGMGKIIFCVFISHFIKSKKNFFFNMWKRKPNNKLKKRWYNNVDAFKFLIL